MSDFQWDSSGTSNDSDMGPLQNPRLVISGLALADPHVGQGVYSLRLIAGLVKRLSDDFVVVAPQNIGRPSEVPIRNFIHLPPFLAPKHRTLYQAVASERLLRFVRRRFPNAVFHSPGPILGLTRPKTTIVTLHDCLYRHFSNYDGRFGHRRLLYQATERFAKRASLVLTDSEFSRRDLGATANIPAEKMTVLYPWVGNEFLEEIKPESVKIFRKRMDLPDRFWLYLGGYDYRKNIEFLLAAYATAGRGLDLPPLVLAGKIPSEKGRANCDVMGTLRRINFPQGKILLPGRISLADLPVLYRAASLLIYPSLMEGFGLPPAEAMAVGTPVLAADNSSIPEVVLRRECLFDATKPETLIEKLGSAAMGERQFLCPLPPLFTEAHGITGYLRAIKGAATRSYHVESQHP